MKVLGFLFVLATLGGNKSFFDKYDDFSLDVQSVGQLIANLFNNTSTNSSEPVFTLDDVREANFINKGTVAKYFSNSFRDYVVHHNVSSDEEGFIVTLNHKAVPEINDTSVTTNNENEEPEPPTVIFIPKPGLNSDSVDEDELNEAINGYVENVQSRLESGIPCSHVKKNLAEDILSVQGSDGDLQIRASNENETETIKELSNEPGAEPILMELQKDNGGMSVDIVDTILKNENTTINSTYFESPILQVTHEQPEDTKIKKQIDNSQITVEETINNTISQIEKATHENNKEKNTGNIEKECKKEENNTGQESTQEEIAETESTGKVNTAQDIIDEESSEEESSKEENDELENEKVNDEEENKKKEQTVKEDNSNHDKPNVENSPEKNNEKLDNEAENPVTLEEDEVKSEELVAKEPTVEKVDDKTYYTVDKH